jgi:hypothetical protein
MHFTGLTLTLTLTLTDLDFYMIIFLSFRSFTLQLLTLFLLLNMRYFD